MIDKIQFVLRIVFYVLAALTLGCYLADKAGWMANVAWVYCGVAALGVSIVRYVMNRL